MIFSSSICAIISIIFQLKNNCNWNVWFIYAVPFNDACLSDPCQNGGSCINTPGDVNPYLCDCQRGFRGQNCEGILIILPLCHCQPGYKETYIYMYTSYDCSLSMFADFVIFPLPENLHVQLDIKLELTMIF